MTTSSGVVGGGASQSSRLLPLSPSCSHISLSLRWQSLHLSSPHYPSPPACGLFSIAEQVVTTCRTLRTMDDYPRGPIADQRSSSRSNPACRNSGSVARFRPQRRPAQRRAGTHHTRGRLRSSGAPPARRSAAMTAGSSIPPITRSTRRVTNSIRQLPICLPPPLISRSATPP